jgi:hypothetical protein
MSALAGEPMPDPQTNDTYSQVDTQTRNQEEERRAHTRNETVLNRIEDATYAILRKHEKKSA